MLALLLSLTVLAAAGHATDLEVDFVMFDDPKLELPRPIRTFSPKLKPLWLKALAGPEADLRRQAAQTIVLAHRRGMPGLGDTAKPLMKVMDAPDQHPVVLLAAARALIELDARQAAPLLFEHAMTGGMEMAQLVEPALGRWDHQPIRKVWLDRLSEPRASRRPLMLAIRGVATVGETTAQSRLLELALDRDAGPDVRLEAARALGRTQTKGLEEHARKLARDKSPQRIAERLAAASLVTGHRGEAAQSLLLELAVDPEPSVAAIALGRLLEIDFMLVISIVEPTIANDDANVRHLGARALDAWATPQAIARLAPMLDDPHVDVRRYVCRSLLEMTSDPNLRDLVLDEALKMLATDRWRGLEQASLLLVALDQKRVADRLVELLDFERPEVFVTAAWGLRRLAVRSTLSAMLDKAERLTKRLRAPSPVGDDLALQSRHLFEAFAQMKYMPSAPLARQFIPKDSGFGPETRATAIWALGHLHAGQPQTDLVRLLTARLTDTNPDDPEFDEVRLASAISLGRMKAEKALPALRQTAPNDTVSEMVEYASHWAIQQITGKPMPEPGVYEAAELGWFLEPID